MSKSVEVFAKEFLGLPTSIQVNVVCTRSTDEIISAAIVARALQRLDRKFSIKIHKHVSDVERVLSAPLRDSEATILLHGTSGEGSSRVFALASPDQNAAEAAYLFARELSSDNRDLAKIALVSIVAQNPHILLDEINPAIVSDAGQITTMKGPTLYPATRPLSRAIEYSTVQYIPGVTGNSNGVRELLQEAKLPEDKTLLELSEEEISRLVSAVLSRRARKGLSKDIVGNLYAIDLFDKKEDLREVAVLINSCAHSGHESTAIAYCLGNSKARNRALEVYAQYKQEVLSSLKVVESLDTVQERGFIILQAKNRIKPSMIDTVCSLLVSSHLYPEGTVLLAVTSQSDKVCISARAVGVARDVRAVLEDAARDCKDGECKGAIAVSGDSKVAKAVVEFDDETSFMSILRRKLEIEVMKM